MLKKSRLLGYYCHEPGDACFSDGQCGNYGAPDQWACVHGCEGATGS